MQARYGGGVSDARPILVGEAPSPTGDRYLNDGDERARCGETLRRALGLADEVELAGRRTTGVPS